MATHTPGPWTIKRSKSGRRIKVSGPGWTTFAKIWVRLEGSGLDHDEGVANAHLIAASPELLAACKLAQDLVRANCPTPEFVTRVNEAVNAAIAKATA